MTKKGQVLTPEQREARNASNRAYALRNKEKIAAKNKAWKDANRERLLAERREWQSANRPRVNANRRAARAANPEQTRERQRHEDLRRHYGISAVEYDEMLLAQNGCCAICQGSCPTGRRLAVDHDHETNEIRGLLCSLCNRGVGMFRDDPDTVHAAASYLRFFKRSVAA